MGRINGILQHTFIAFNALFAILGGLLIIVAIMSSAYSHQLTEVSSLVWGWVFAIGVLSISCLGIHAASSEKEIILKIFAGFMVVGMIIMLIFGIIVVVTRNKVLSGPDHIYAQPCSEIRCDHDFDIAMGLYFGFAIIALLGLLVSLLMIYQVRRHDSSGGSSIAMRVY